MKISYKFVDAQLRGTDLQYGRPYNHPEIHSVTLVKDEHNNDELIITLVIPTEL